MKLPSRLRSHFPEITKELNPLVEGALRLGAEAIAEGARSRVPVNTGALRDAIHVDRRGDGEYAVVAGDTDAFYGHMVEHGTTQTPAQPFLVPAFEASVKRVEKDIQAALKRL